MVHEENKLQASTPKETKTKKKNKIKIGQNKN